MNLRSINVIQRPKPWAWSEIMPIPLLQKDKGAKVSREGHALSFLGLSWSHSHRLHSKRTNCHWHILQQSAGQVTSCSENKFWGMLTRRICLLADYALANLSQIAVDKARACGFGNLQNPLFLPTSHLVTFSCSQKWKIRSGVADLTTQMTSLMKWDSDFRHNLQTSTVMVSRVSKNTGKNV